MVDDEPQVGADHRRLVLALAVAEQRVRVADQRMRRALAKRDALVDEARRQDVPWKEIARAQGLKPAAVRKQWSRRQQAEFSERRIAARALWNEGVVMHKRLARDRDDAAASARSNSKFSVDMERVRSRHVRARDSAVTRRPPSTPRLALRKLRWSAGNRPRGSKA